jgi:hypothetical protein
MKTAQHVIESRNRHHIALASLTVNPTQPGLPLWRKLRKVESLASRGATAYCNGDTISVSNKAGDRVYPFHDGGDTWERFITREIIPAIRRILGRLPDGFFVNGDPRGYALKLDNDKATIPAGLHTDWGRYGILAPELN